MEQDIYVFGHTHFPFVKTAGNKMIINAGSAGRPKNCDNRATYVLLEWDGLRLNSTIQKVLYDVERVALEIEKSGPDNYFADFIRNGGDLESICSIKGDCSCDLD